MAPSFNAPIAPMHNLKPPPLTSTTSPSTVINPAPLDSGYVSVGSSTAPSASSSSPTKLSPALAAATSTIPPPPPAGGLEDENEDDEEDEEDQDLEESYDNNAKNLLIGAELIDLTTDTLKTETPHQPPTSTSSPRKLLSGIRLPALCSPRSAYEGYVPPHGLPISKERSVLREFLDLDDASTDSSTPHEAGEFTAYKLEEFCFYHPANDKRLALELCALDHLSVDRGKNVLLFDGVLINTHPTTGETIRRYVEGVPCTLLSIGNYEDLDTHSVAGAVWVQSQAAKGAGDIWYQLGSAEEGYGKRYHEPFLWLANFAKYFVDYLAVRGEEGTKVELADFKEGFGEWCESLHGGDEAFKRWKEMYVAGKNWGPKGGDFRQAVAVHYPFLWNQVYNVGVLASNRRMFTHTVWDEVMRLEAIKPAPGKLVNETIVTPLVYDCFYHIFGDKLKSMEPRLPREKQEGAKLVLEKAEVLSPVRVRRDEFGRVKESREEQAEVQPGDVVAVVKDEVSNWKGTSEYWYAYVQRVNKRTTGDTLDVIWLYLPEDTILGQMKYPYANELFFSDNCNCTDTRLRLDEVVFKVSTAMFCGPGESGAEYFVRQKFSDAEATFTTLKRVDLQCECSKPLVSAYEQARRTYTPGDTVLVESDTEAGGVLEPAQVVRFDEASQCVEMRQLFRRGRDFADLEDQTRQSWAPNELVYTEYLVLVPPQYISRRCYIRFIAPGCRPITPYDRGGTGDCFFIYQKRLDDGSLAPAYPPPEGFTQGFDPDAPPEGLTQLRGMDLYCGGGNFGRGIEEGGAVVNRWAVDFDVTALHTYRANLRAPAETQLYLGSVNNYLRDGLLGRFSAQVPPPGQVDFISAGSPCQGFSSANGDRDSERSLQNSSLVASVASFVDFYRPKFALLENVHGLAQDRIKKKDGLPYNVFSQLLCSLVAIGYQCQQFTLDAWSFGSCQTRTRLFVSIAAPGQLLPPRPGRSHEHPSTVRSKSLFEAPNGKKFGGRELAGPCTFPFVSTDSVIGSLPYLGDNHQGICIPFPDHRLSRIEARNTRLLMTHIPRHPRHLASLRRAINAGRVPPSLDFYRPTVSRLRDHSRSWSRISGEELCRTITTTITPQCNYTGRWMHYDQHRLLTVMEVRRVQSFPDDEVLLGGAVKTFKIVGNSVDRMVAVAWGVSIREAWWGKGGAGSTGDSKTIIGTRSFRKWLDQYTCVQDVSKSQVAEIVDSSEDEIEDDGPDGGDDVSADRQNKKKKLVKKADLKKERSVLLEQEEDGVEHISEDDEDIDSADEAANQLFVSRAVAARNKRPVVDPFKDAESGIVEGTLQDEDDSEDGDGGDDDEVVVSPAAPAPQSAWRSDKFVMARKIQRGGPSSLSRPLVSAEQARKVVAKAAPVVVRIDGDEDSSDGEDSIEDEDEDGVERVHGTAMGGRGLGFAVSASSSSTTPRVHHKQLPLSSTSPKAMRVGVPQESASRPRQPPPPTPVFRNNTTTTSSFSSSSASATKKVVATTATTKTTSSTSTSSPIPQNSNANANANANANVIPISSSDDDDGEDGDSITDPEIQVVGVGRNARKRLKRKRELELEMEVERKKGGGSSGSSGSGSVKKGIAGLGFRSGSGSGSGSGGGKASEREREGREVVMLDE